MNVLCINTAFNEAFIALKYQTKKFYKKINSNAKHSENLLKEIENIFEKIKSEKNSNSILKNLDVISIVIGPGSFTGLRIGIATVKALLCVNKNLKCIAINSLELIGFEYNKNSTPIINALSGYYFVGNYNCENKLIENPQMLTEIDLLNYKNKISIEKLNLKSKIIRLTAKNLLKYTEYKIKNNSFTNENELKPLYIRPSQAEANLNAN